MCQFWLSLPRNILVVKSFDKSILFYLIEAPQMLWYYGKPVVPGFSIAIDNVIILPVLLSKLTGLMNDVKLSLNHLG